MALSPIAFVPSPDMTGAAMLAGNLSTAALAAAHRAWQVIIRKEKNTQRRAKGVAVKLSVLVKQSLKFTVLSVHFSLAQFAG